MRAFGVDGGKSANELRGLEKKLKFRVSGLDGDSWSEKFGPRAQNVDVEQGKHFGRLVAAMGEKTLIAGDVLRIEANGVDALVARQKNGPLIMEALRNDGDAALPEYFFGANDGIERVKTGVIANNVTGRDARLNEVILHGRGFVVGRDVVIAADQEVIDFVRLIQTRGGADSICEKWILIAVTQFFRTTEH